MYRFTAVSILTLFTALFLGSLSACHFPPRIHRIDIHQGNIITTEMLSKIQLGMSQDAVIEVMGSPTLHYEENAERLDYYFQVINGNGLLNGKKYVNFIFNKNKLISVGMELDLPLGLDKKMAIDLLGEPTTSRGNKQILEYHYDFKDKNHKTLIKHQYILEFINDKLTHYQKIN
ncbi:MAG: outer membrane protein assembly factor BamE [Francisellaceae bacterium]|nr:outer membrane protein assembly factor BamE [Francisellaceae bacterium]